MSIEDIVKVLGKIRRGEFVTKQEFDVAMHKAIEVMVKQITIRSSW